MTLKILENPLTELINIYHKKLMIVETGYPFTLNNVDPANNVLGSDTLINGFLPTQQGQLDYLKTLTFKTKEVVVLGVIYC